MNRFLLILTVFMLPISSFSQFYLQGTTGYNFSTNRFIKDSGFIYPCKLTAFDNNSNYAIASGNLSEVEMIQINLPLGSGINNEISLGYMSEIIDIRLSFGANLNSLNFSYLNRKNTFAKSVHFDVPMNDNRTRHYYYENVAYYNLFYIAPEAGFSYKLNNLALGISIGLVYYYFDYRIEYKDVRCVFYNDVQTAEFVSYSTHNFTPSSSDLDEKQINWINQTRESGVNTNLNNLISFNIGIGANYKIAKNLEAVFNIKYNPLIISPIISLVHNRHSTATVDGEVSTGSINDYFSLTGYDQVNRFDFSTIRTSIGVRYVFGNRGDSNY